MNSHLCSLGAGLGLFLTYATYMRRTQGAVKLGTVTPFFNNVVRYALMCPQYCNNFNGKPSALDPSPPHPPPSSLLCGLLVFSTVFSVQFQEGKSKEEVIGVLKENGPANTGLTFIW